MVERLLSQQLRSSSSICSSSDPVALGAWYWCTSEEAPKQTRLQGIVVSVCAEPSPPQQHSSSHADVIVPLSTHGCGCCCFNQKKSTLPGCSNKAARKLRNVQREEDLLQAPVHARPALIL